MKKTNKLRNSNVRIIGTNQKKVKDYNKALVLEYIRLYEPLSRSEIAIQTNLSAQTVSNLVNELIEEELVKELSTRYSQSRGANPTDLGVMQDSRYSLGIQIQFSRFIVALINLRGEIVSKLDVHIDTNHHKTFTDLLYEVIDGVLIDLSDLSKLMGIGIGVPSVEYYANSLDPEVGLAHLSPKSIVSIIEALARKYGVEVWVGNNAQAGAVGEYWMDRGQASRSFLYFYVGENIGGGLILNGESYSGYHGRALEVGHTQYVPNGLTCYCGTKGCLDQYASPNAIRKALNLPEESDFPKIVKSAKGGDNNVRHVISNASRALADAIINLHMLFDTPECVIGGPHAVDLFDWVEPIIIQQASARNLDLTARLSKWGIDAGAIGAASAVIHDVIWSKPSHLFKTQ